jgi:hypothetical protein
MSVLIVFIIAVMTLRFIFSYRHAALCLAIVFVLLEPLRSRIFSIVQSKMITMLNYHIGLNYLGGSNFKLLPDRYYAFLISHGSISKDIYAGPDIVWGWLGGIKVFLLEPSPFIISKAVQVFIVPEMIAWYLVLAFFAYGVFKCFKSITVEKMSILVLAVIFASAIGLSEANYETLIRHRDMAMPIFIVLAAYGMTEIGRIASSRRPR